MLLTEAEARSKECRIGGQLHSMKLATEDRYAFPMCVASRCCHWRRALGLTAQGGAISEYGYCGLAGAPEFVVGPSAREIEVGA